MTRVFFAMEKIVSTSSRRAAPSSRTSLARATAVPAPPLPGSEKLKKTRPSGKTSTMKMITTVSPITEGKLSVFGLDPTTEGREIRTRIGVVPQEDNLDLELTVAENLYIFGRYHDMNRADIRKRTTELLEFAQLSDRAKSLVDPLSGGMKRRLTIARALINDPELVVLDEPTTGLDPQARHVLWDRLYRLKQQGATLIITTHYMDEAEQLCDRLVVMDKGQIVAEGSPRTLITEHATREVVELRFQDGHQRARFLSSNLSSSVARYSPTGCSSTPKTPKGRSTRWGCVASIPSRYWCAARHSKTSSSNSPGGA